MKENILFLYDWHETFANNCLMYQGKKEKTEGYLDYKLGLQVLIIVSLRRKYFD